MAVMVCITANGDPETQRWHYAIATPVRPDRGFSFVWRVSINEERVIYSLVVLEHVNNFLHPSSTLILPLPV